MYIEMPRVQFNAMLHEEKGLTHLTTFPTALHVPFPSPSHCTIHLPTTTPPGVIVSAMVSSRGKDPCFLPSSISSAGSCDASANSTVASGRVAGARNAVSYTLVVCSRRRSVRVVISTPGPVSIQRSLVTYGLPAHATSPVDTPLVASATPAKAKRPERGKLEAVSIIKMNGVRDAVRASEDREKILRRRKVLVRGP